MAPLLLLAGHGGIAFMAAADTHYVSLSGTSTPPYTNWATAAAALQWAVDAATAGDTVLVTNGIYSSGTRHADNEYNRVVCASAIAIRSVNGPSVTVILGSGPLGTSAVRCAFLAGGASLEGFTLTGGCTGDDNGNYGGGISMAQTSFVSRCVIRGNMAGFEGGGVAGGLAVNCDIHSNTAGAQGGGAAKAVLRDCSVRDNFAGWFGGGVSHTELDGCTVVANRAGNAGGGALLSWGRDSIIQFNDTRFSDENWDVCTFTNCSTTPMPPGRGNFTGDPGLLGLSNLHLAASSPCIDAGSTNVAPSGRKDLDGETRVTGAGFDAGCDEYVPLTAPSSVVARVAARYTSTVPGRQLTLFADMDGRAESFVWNLADGTRVSNQTRIVHAWTNPGTYPVVLSARTMGFEVGACTTAIVVVPAFTNYVSTNGMHLHPFTNWATAATNLQSAIDANAVIGGLTLVGPGVYQDGSRERQGLNRIVLDRPIALRSANGPALTTIRGAGPAGSNAVRCAYVGEGASIEGFTLRDGRTSTQEYSDASSGGGVWCEKSAVVSNCVIQDNAAYSWGGGVYLGTVVHSWVSSNAAAFGGGLSALEAASCRVIGNTAWARGGGLGTGLQLAVVANIAGFWRMYFRGENLVIYGNAADYGGGTYGGELHNCTVASNTAVQAAGGVDGTRLVNTIVYENAAPTSANYSTVASNIHYSCVTPDAGAVRGNITNAPRFTRDGEFDLEVSSDCIDAGRNDEWMNGASDLAGRPRVMHGRVDIGACEFRFEASLRGLLAGAWSATNAAMRPGAPPWDSPYAAAGTRATNIPMNAVDWVLVTVRDSPTGATAAAVSAFMMPDGTIRRADGGTNVYVEAKGNLYGVLQHRNHLAVMSAVPVFTNRYVQFDFSADPNLLWSGTNSVIQVSTNRWAMIPGDADGDGSVRSADNEILQTQTP